MSFEVSWSPRARKKLKKLDKVITTKIVKKVLSIKDNPSRYLGKLKDINAWSLRVGDYRVIIDVSLKNKEIEVLTLGHRKNIYEELSDLF